MRFQDYGFDRDRFDTIPTGIASLPTALSPAPTALTAPQMLNFIRGNPGDTVPRNQEELDALIAQNNYLAQASPEMGGQMWNMPTTFEEYQQALPWNLDINDLYANNRQFESKYNQLTPVPGQENLFRATLQQPGAHKYDTMEAFYRLDPATGQAQLVGDPQASRQNSSTKDFVQQDLPWVLAMMAPGVMPGLSQALGSTAAAGAAYGAAVPALTGGDTQDIIKGGVLGGIGGAAKDYFSAPTSGAPTSAGGITATTNIPNPGIVNVSPSELSSLAPAATVGANMGIPSLLGGASSGFDAFSGLPGYAIDPGTASMTQAQLDAYRTAIDSPALYTPYTPADFGASMAGLPPTTTPGQTIEITGNRPPATSTAGSGMLPTLGGIGGLGGLSEADLSPVPSLPTGAVPPATPTDVGLPALAGMGAGAAAGGIGSWIKDKIPGLSGLVDKVPESLLKGLLPAIGGYLAYQDAKKPQLTGFSGSIQPRTATQTVTQGKYGPIARTTFAQGGIAGIPRYLGNEHDGMQDTIPAHIDGKQPAALSGGEFVIPADVVSHLGNGNSQAGAKQLFEMMDRIRHARTGTPKQGKQINPAQFMPK